MHLKGDKSILTACSELFVQYKNIFLDNTFRSEIIPEISKSYWLKSFIQPRCLKDQDQVVARIFEKQHTKLLLNANFHMQPLLIQHF